MEFAYVDLTMTKKCAVWCAVFALIAAMTSCSMFSPTPGATFAAFADALTRKDAQAAAAQTTDPAAALPVIEAMFAGMGADAAVAVTAPDGAEPTVDLDYVWSFGPGREFDYRTTAQARELDDGWRIDWSPAVLHSRLRDGVTLQYSQDPDLLTPVVDRDGQPLMDWQTVGVVMLDRAQLASADALAAVLAPFDAITGDWIRAQFDSSQDQVVTVMRLRSADLATVAAPLATIPGVTVSEQGALLTANPELRSPAISGLPGLWEDTVKQAAGWSVTLVDGDGTPTDQLTSTPAADTGPLRTALDVRLQLLAQQAVDRETRPTVLVALAPSTGGILATAQNAAADAQGAIAFSGLYPPGSVFKTITTAAALEAGLVQPDSSVDCPGRLTIENRTIPNDDDFELGVVPMSEAFARSCNTTMAALADRLPPNALTDTALQFGIGVDFVIPGLTTVTGSVPNADTPAQRVENGIGQGTVTASPFGLAVAEASLANGTRVTPTLVIGQETTADSAPATLNPAVTEALRGMMRRTVTDGTATALADIADLGGKTGTAEFGDNTSSHGWFAGIVGDIAFATLVVGGDSSAPAITVSGDFLRPAVGQ